MPMITKAEAVVLFNNYNSSFPERVDQILRQAANSGLTSVTFSYGNVTNAVANAVGVTLQAGGWTVSVNTTDKTVTVS